MRTKVPDMYDAFCWHEAQQERELRKREICSNCGEHIPDEYCFYINGEYICESCMEDYKVETPVEE